MGASERRDVERVRWLGNADASGEAERSAEHGGGKKRRGTRSNGLQKPAAASRLFDEKATASSMRPIRGNPGGKRDWDAWTLTLPEIRMRVACPVSWCCPLSLSVAHNVRDVSDTFRSIKASRMERSSAFSVSSCISHTEYIETVRLCPKSWTWNFHVSIVPFFEQLTRNNWFEFYSLTYLTTRSKSFFNARTTNLWFVLETL